MKILFIVFNYKKNNNIFKINDIFYNECIFSIDLNIINKNHINCGYSKKKIEEMKDNNTNVDKVESILLNIIKLMKENDFIYFLNKNLFEIFKLEVNRKLNFDISIYNEKVKCLNINKDNKYIYDYSNIVELMENYLNNPYKKNINDIISNTNSESSISDENIEIYLPINIAEKPKKLKIIVKNLLKCWSIMKK